MGAAASVNSQRKAACLLALRALRFLRERNVSTARGCADGDVECVARALVRVAADRRDAALDADAAARACDFARATGRYDRACPALNPLLCEASHS